MIYERFTVEYHQRKYVDVSKFGFSRTQSVQIVDAVFEELKEGLAREEVAKISGFGTFEVKQKNPRRGRNPQTGESIVLPSRKVLSFRASHVLKARINNSDSNHEQEEIRQSYQL